MYVYNVKLTISRCSLWGTFTCRRVAAGRWRLRRLCDVLPGTLHYHRSSLRRRLCRKFVHWWSFSHSRSTLRWNRLWCRNFVHWWSFSHCRSTLCWKRRLWRRNAEHRWSSRRFWKRRKDINICIQIYICSNILNILPVKRTSDVVVGDHGVELANGIATNESIIVWYNEDCKYYNDISLTLSKQLVHNLSAGKNVVSLPPSLLPFGYLHCFHSSAQAEWRKLRRHLKSDIMIFN